MKVMDETVMFRMPGDELTAFKRRISREGLTISVFLRMSIENYLRRTDVMPKASTIPIPFYGCLKDEQGDYRDRAAEYVLGRHA